MQLAVVLHLHPRRKGAVELLEGAKARQDRFSLETLEAFHDIFHLAGTPGRVRPVVDLFHPQLGKQNEKMLAHIHPPIIAVRLLRQSPTQDGPPETILHAGQFLIPIVAGLHDLAREIVHPREQIGHALPAGLVRMGQRDTVPGVSLPELVGVGSFESAVDTARWIASATSKLVPRLLEVQIQSAR